MNKQLVRNMCVPYPERETAGWWICRRYAWKNACLGVLVAVLHHKHLKSHFVEWFWSLIEAEICYASLWQPAQQCAHYFCLKGQLRLCWNIFLGFLYHSQLMGLDLPLIFPKWIPVVWYHFRMELRKEEGGCWWYNLGLHSQDVYSNNYTWMCSSEIFFSWPSHKMTWKIRRQSYIQHTCESALSPKVTSCGKSSVHICEWVKAWLWYSL